MELILPTQQIKTALPYLTKYVGKAKKGPNTYIGLEFKIYNNTLTLIGFDGTSGIKYDMGRVQNQNFKATIDFAVFEQVINHTTVDSVKFWFEESAVKISCGKSKYTLKYIDTSYDECFSCTPTSDTWLTISVANLVKVFKYTTHYICNDDNMFFLKGILFDGNFVATDTKTIGVYPYAEKLPKNYMIPKQLYERVTSFPDKDRVFTFYECDNAIVYTSEGIECFSQLLNGKFPLYSTVLEKVMTHPYTVTFSKTDLLSACERLVPFNDPKALQKVNIHVSSDNMVLTTGTVERDKEGTEEIQLTSSNVDTSIGFVMNLKKLLIIAASYPNDIMSMSFSTDLKLPIKFATESGAQVLDCVIRTTTN